MRHPVWPCHLTRGQKQPRCYGKFVWRETEASSLWPWDWASALLWIWNGPQRPMCTWEACQSMAVQWGEWTLRKCGLCSLHIPPQCTASPHAQSNRTETSQTEDYLCTYRHKAYIFAYINHMHIFPSQADCLKFLVIATGSWTYWILNSSHVFNVRIAARAWTGSCGEEQGKEEKGQRGFELRARQKHCPAEFSNLRIRADPFNCTVKDQCSLLKLYRPACLQANGPKAQQQWHLAARVHIKNCIKLTRVAKPGNMRQQAGSVGVLPSLTTRIQSWGLHGRRRDPIYQVVLWPAYMHHDRHTHIQINK